MGKQKHKPSWKTIEQCINEPKIINTRFRNYAWYNEIKKRQKSYKPSTYNIENLRSGKFTIIKSNAGGVI